MSNPNQIRQTQLRNKSRKICTKLVPFVKGRIVTSAMAALIDCDDMSIT
jgi:hypothetical protein